MRVILKSTLNELFYETEKVFKKEADDSWGKKPIPRREAYNRMIEDLKELKKRIDAQAFDIKEADHEKIIFTDNPDNGVDGEI